MHDHRVAQPSVLSGHNIVDRTGRLERAHCSSAGDGPAVPEDIQTSDIGCDACRSGMAAQGEALRRQNVELIERDYSAPCPLCLHIRRPDKPLQTCIWVLRSGTGSTITLSDLTVCRH